MCLTGGTRCKKYRESVDAIEPLVPAPACNPVPRYIILYVLLAREHRVSIKQPHSKPLNASADGKLFLCA